MKKRTHSLWTQMTAILLAFVCVVGLFPFQALAAADTIKLDSFGMSGVSYESAALGRCSLHQMYYANGNKTTAGFCGTKGGSMGQSLLGQTWGHKTTISDSTVSMMMAYYYTHSTGVFTDQAKALGVDTIWDSGYTWYMNAWVQAIIWRYQQGSMGDPVVACAEELMAVFNSLDGANYTSIDQEKDGTSFRSRSKYILDLGAQGVWGDCAVYEYTFTGAGSSTHPASSVQKVILGELAVDTTTPEYILIIKKVDSTNPTKGLQGAEFHVQSENGAFSKDVTTGPDGTCTLKGLTANTYAVTETAPPPGGYMIDNPGPEYVVLPNGSSNTVTVTFTDTPPATGEGTIRKVDADDPTKGLAGAVIKITGVDNNFVGTYTTGSGGYLTDVPWDQMPVGSFTAEEMTPPEGYTKSTDQSKVKQTFVWDGRTDIALVFENDSKVKIRLIKLDDSNNPLPGAVFNILRDGQVVGTEATKADGSITVTDVTEGMYAFVEVSVPAPWAKLTEPVIAHVDQATVNGGGTITVTAADKKLPTLTLLKRDSQTKEAIPGTHFEVKGIHFGFHRDVETGPDGKAVLKNIPVDSYEVIEKSVPDPWVIGEEPTQTVYLGPGEDQQLIFDNLKQPLLTLKKIDADSQAPIPQTVLTVKALDGTYQDDWTTGADGTVSLRVNPGVYEVTEKSVPAPYYLPDKDADRTQTITLRPGDEQTLIFRNRKAPEVTIFKENSITGEPIEHAKFHITYTSNGEAAEAPATIDYGEVFTDAKGEIRVHELGKRLYPGEFTITELEPADGFQLKEPLTQTVIIHGNESKTVRFQNTPLSALVVWKYDSITGEPVEGAIFQVRYMSGTSGSGGTVIGTYKTGPGGSFTINRLKAGAYLVEELASDGDHVMDTAPQTAYISGKEQDVVQLYFGNSPKGSILVKKIDASTHEPLSDCEFFITDSHGTMLGDANGKFVTDSAGTILISNINPGTTLVVRETKAKENYILDDVPQTATIKAGQTVTLEFRNQPKGSVTLYKFSSLDRRTPLEGVGFKITFADGRVVDNIGGKLSSNGIYYTDSEGQINISGVTGTLVFTEISTIPGYLIDENRKSQTIVVNPNDHQSVYFYNQPIGNLVIKKMSSTTKEPLSDVVIRVTRTDGTVVGESNGEFRTDESGFIKIPVEPGGYIVQEVKSKPGYLLDDTPKTIEVKGPGTYNIELFNQPLGSLVIHKYSSLDRKTPLAGVQFKVTYAPGCVVDNENGNVSSNGIYYTGPDGTITIRGIVGTVVVTEQATIPGYTIDPETRSQTIVVNPDDVQHAYFYNSPKNTLIIEKYLEEEGSEHKPLKGVTFLVTDSSGAVVGNSNGEFISGDDGRVVIPGVEPGSTITVREIKVPEGVVLDGIPKTIKISDDGANILRFYNKKTGYLVVKKMDSVTKQPLAGVEFELTYADGSFVDDVFGHLSSKGRFKTNDAGEIRVPVVGTVVVKEVKCLPGYTIDPATQTQTVKVNPADTQTLTVYNTPGTTLTIQKLVTGTKDKPLAGVEFLITDSSGAYVGPNNGIYRTDEYGRITLSGLKPGTVITAKEIKTVDGFVLDGTPKSIEIKEGEAQTLTFYNAPVGGLELIKVSASDETKRIPGVTFEIRGMDGALIETVTTGENGRVHVDLDAGDYYCVELKAAEGFKIDATPHYFTIRDNETTTLTVTNAPFSGIIIHKINSVTGDGIYDVKFLLYGENRNPIGEYSTDNEGYIYIDDLTVQGKGRLYLRELEAAPGYKLDKEYKTIYVQPGKTIEIEWENTPITGQIQVMKYAAEYNEVTGTPAGTPLQGAVYEISDPRSNKVVDYITTDARGIAASKPLPLGRYKIVEVTAPAYWQLSKTVFDETLEYAGQIIKVSDFDKPSNLGVVITKRGNAEALAGSQMRYDFTVGNTSNVPLENFYWHDRIPTDAARAMVISTGTYSARLNYRILYKTNYSGTYQVLASNLITTSAYSFSLNAIPMQAGEVVTDVYFDFGKVPVGFQSTSNPTLTVTVSGTAANGYQLTNRADAGGKYQGTWQTAQGTWVTVIRKLTPTVIPQLPKTGY